MFAATSVGRVRLKNEDSFYISSENAGHHIYIVADGMGGHRAGEVASLMARDKALESYLELVDLPIEDRVFQAVNEANSEIYSAMLANPELEGMGTTITFAVIDGLKLVVGQVGDSRAYLISGDGTIRQITVDHSLVQELISIGRITKEQARSHPYRHMVTRVLGTQKFVNVDVYSLMLAEGDKLLICSDGLNAHVYDREMPALIEDKDDPAQFLVDEAVRRGGSDNVTVIVVQVDGGEVFSP